MGVIGNDLEKQIVARTPLGRTGQRAADRKMSMIV